MNGGSAFGSYWRFGRVLGTVVTLPWRLGVTRRDNVMRNARRGLARRSTGYYWLLDYGCCNRPRNPEKHKMITVVNRESDLGTLMSRTSAAIVPC